MTDNNSNPSFCSVCGSPLSESYVADDTVARMVCGHCGEVVYRNPKILVTTIVEAGGRILLCRRAKPPKVGYWTLPGGFMECGESLEHAAARETLEETGIAVDADKLRFYAISSLADINQVYIGFLAKLSGNPIPVCGQECQEVQFFTESEVPWDAFAYTDLAAYLRRFYNEYRRDEDHIHIGQLDQESMRRHDFLITSASREKIPRSENK